MHDEATESPRVTAPARARECKQPSAPGEVSEEVLSDRGSTPLTSIFQNKAIRSMTLFYLYQYGDLIS